MQARADIGARQGWPILLILLAKCLREGDLRLAGHSGGQGRAKRAATGLRRASWPGSLTTNPMHPGVRARPTTPAELPKLLSAHTARAAGGGRISMRPLRAEVGSRAARGWKARRVEHGGSLSGQRPKSGGLS